MEAINDLETRSFCAWINIDKLRKVVIVNINILRNWVLKVSKKNGVVTEGMINVC